MNFELTRAGIASYFFDNWDQGDLPVVAENQPAPNTNGIAWGRFSVLFGQGDPLALGDQSVRVNGMAVLQVIIPEGAGTAAATAAGGAFATLMNRRQLILSSTVTASFQAVGMVDAGGREGYVQKNFSVQFRADTLG